MNALIAQPPEGIRVIVSELDVCDVQAWILGPESTPYEGGHFKVKLALGADFPAAPPKCYFITKIFHPNVSKCGEVCVNTLKKDWNKDSGIERILLTVKCLLIVPNPESALNEEAGKLLLENYEDYAKYARMMTKVHAQNKAVDFSSININNSSSTTPTSTTTTMTTTTTTTTPSNNTTSTSSPKKFVSSKSASPQITTTSTNTATTTMTTNNSTTNSSATPALITPLTVSNSMNESKSFNAMNGGGANNHNHLKKNSNSSMNSNDNQLSSNNPTVTPKKRAGDKKLDKKQADKKRSLKRL